MPGSNLSPSLNLQNAPEATKSFVLLIDDPQGANGLGVNHLIAYDIKPGRQHFNQGELTTGKGFTAGTNSKNIQGYFGPCPPVTAGIHNYNFTLIATDLPLHALEKGVTRETLIKQLNGHALAATGMVGQYVVQKLKN